MGGASSRRKGASFERETADELRPIYPSARRGLGQARSGSEVCDVEGTPWWIETKRGKATMSSALKQASEATDGRIPIVIMRRDRADSIVVVELTYFKRIMQDIERLRAMEAGAPVPLATAGPAPQAHRLDTREHMEGE